MCLCCSCRLLMHCADAAGAVFNTVDIFNATSGTWSTAALSSAKYIPAAAALPNYGLAIFAGGNGA